MALHQSGKKNPPCSFVHSLFRDESTFDGNNNNNNKQQTTVTTTVTAKGEGIKDFLLPISFNFNTRTPKTARSRFALLLLACLFPSRLKKGKKKKETKEEAEGWRAARKRVETREGWFDSSISGFGDGALRVSGTEVTRKSSSGRRTSGYWGSRRKHGKLPVRRLGHATRKLVSLSLSLVLCPCGSLPCRLVLSFVFPSSGSFHPLGHFSVVVVVAISRRHRHRHRRRRRQCRLRARESFRRPKAG